MSLSPKVRGILIDKYIGRQVYYLMAKTPQAKYELMCSAMEHFKQDLALPFGGSMKEYRKHYYFENKEWLSKKAKERIEEEKENFFYWKKQHDSFLVSFQGWVNKGRRKLIEKKLVKLRKEFNALNEQYLFVKKRIESEEDYGKYLNLKKEEDLILEDLFLLKIELEE